MVTTVKPLHSIAAAVMKGIGDPTILVDGAASPHGFALKPSQAVMLQGADVVFWVGPELAPALAKPIGSMTQGAVTVEMMDAPGIVHLGLREGDQFDGHDHDEDDDHADEDGHSQEEHVLADAGHAAESHEHNDDHDDHDDHDEHGHGEGRDAHIWLNPDNGIAIASRMAETLAGVDPDNADAYRNNAASFAERIAMLEAEISARLKPVKGKTFIVFHDAYHHFEHHFGIEASGAITLSPETLSSADRISQIRHRIKDLAVACVFQEPQFDAKLVNVVIEGSDARIGTLDPLGTRLKNGPELYPDLLKGLADGLAECLGNEG
ncbi:MAG: zinc ABC transporter substrate-binding protein [Roseibium sp.]